MADKTIGELKSLTTGDSKITIKGNESILFAAQYDGAAYKVSGAEFFNELVSTYTGHGGIEKITGPADTNDPLIKKYTIVYADDNSDTTFTVTNGKGIADISTSYAVSTSKDTVPTEWSTAVPSTWSPSIPYLWVNQKYTFNNDTKEVPSYKEIKYVCAKYGPGIASISQGKRGSDEIGKYTPYTFTMTEGAPRTFKAYDGRSITEIKEPANWDDSSGATNIYTISYSDGSTSTFKVVNGVTGSGAVSTVAGLGPDTNKNVKLILQGTGKPTGTGQQNQLYFDTSSSMLYVCKETGEWSAASVTVDSTLSASSTNPVQNKTIKSALDAKMNNNFSSLGETKTAELSDGYIFPTYYNANYKISWSSIVSALRLKLFGKNGEYLNGILRADGSGNAEVTTVGESDISDGVVTRKKLAVGATESPIETITATSLTSVSDYREKTMVLMPGIDSSIEISVDGGNTTTYVKGFEVAIMPYLVQSATIKFTSGQICAYGQDSVITASSSSPVTITLEKFGMVALKKLVSNVWLITGPCEIE